MCRHRGAPIHHEAPARKHNEADHVPAGGATSPRGEAAGDELEGTIAVAATPELALRLESDFLPELCQAGKWPYSIGSME